MSVNQFKQIQNLLWEDYKAAAKAMHNYPSNENGLTPDHIKSSPEWQKAKQEVSDAFAALRRFNGRWAKKLNKEQV